MKVWKVLVVAVAMGLAVAPAALAGGACCSKDQAVARQVETLPNGVKITLTSSDPKVVAQLQSRGEACGKDCKDCPMHAAGVTRTVEKVANGVTITATAADAALVAKLQQHAATMGQGTMKGACCSKEGGTGAAKGGCCSKGEAKGSGCSKGAGHTAHPTT
ncbi:MAG: hypothetical protein ACP5NF_07080 [Thermoanaerobaculum sp.]